MVGYGAAMEPAATQVSVGGLTFDTVTSGPANGHAVLLLHGFPETSQSWAAQLDALSEAGYRAIAFDQRGYSPRARPTEDAEYHVDHLVADALGVVDAFDIDQFTVVGHDWGGFVAWRLATDHPDRVTSLVAVSTPHPRAFAQALGRIGQRLRSAYIVVFRSRFGARLLEGAGALGLRALFAISRLPRAHARPYIEKARVDRGWLDAALAWYRVNLSALVRNDARVTVPTMYVWSTRDIALGPEAARRTSAFVDGPYRFEVLPRVGHWIPETASGELNRLLLDHLSTVV